MKTLLAILLLSTYSSVAQTILTQFDGDIGTGGSATSKPTYRDHPDATAAANGSQVVEVTGQNVNVYSYDGKLLKSTRTSDLINGAGLRAEKVADPRVIFDPFIGWGRWVLVCSFRRFPDCKFWDRCSDFDLEGSGDFAKERRPHDETGFRQEWTLHHRVRAGGFDLCWIRHSIG